MKFWMFTLVLVGGCQTMVPSAQNRRESRHLEENFSTFQVDEKRLEPWWPSLGSAELNTLMGRVLAANTDLAQGLARLRQVQAQTRITQAVQKPQVDLSGGVEGGRARSAANGEQNVENYNLGIGASYEWDLWGKLAAESESARLTEVATEADYFALQMSLTAEAAERWMELIKTRATREVLHEQLQVNEQILELLKFRLRRSQATALDVLQQERILAQVKALLPDLDAREAAALNELAFLQGESPLSGKHFTAKEPPQLSELPISGIPANLLKNRPDVEAARVRLESGAWQITAAEADLLPSISFGAGWRFNSDDFSSLFENWSALLSGSVQWPVFDGGRRKAEVARLEARFDELFAAYKAQILTAMKEVDNALVSETKQAELISRIEERLDIAKRTQSEASVRYRNGLESYLPVLTALTDSQSLERDLLEARCELVIDRIQIYRALGGAWMKLPMEKE